MGGLMKRAGGRLQADADDRCLRVSSEAESVTEAGSQSYYVLQSTAQFSARNVRHWVNFEVGRVEQFAPASSSVE